MTATAPPSASSAATTRSGSSWCAFVFRAGGSMADQYLALDALADALRQRLVADHDAAEHPVSRRRQTRAQIDDRRDQCRAVDDARRLRRRRAHCDDGAGADPRSGPRSARSRYAPAVDLPPAANRRLSRDLGRRRALAAKRGCRGGSPTRSTASAICRANSRSVSRSPRTTRSTS